MEVSNTPIALQEFFAPLLRGLGSELPGLLLTLFILVVGLMIAKSIGKWVARFFMKTSWINKLAQGNDHEAIAKNIGQLAYYVVLVNVLLIVLERMNITTVLDPLKGLANQFMLSLPKIIGAGIIFYAGWIIAKLAASIVELLAAKFDKALEDKNMDLGFKTSKFLSAFVLGAVLLPIVVAGFEFLSISAISDPSIAMITEFMSAVPNIVGAGLILLVTYMAARFVIFMMKGLLEGMNLNELPKKMGFANILPNNMTFIDFIGSVCMFFIMLIGTTAAIDKLKITIVSQIFASILEFGGGVLLGGVILIVGSFLAGLAYDKTIATTQSKSIASICRFAILGLVLAMGLKSMGLAENIVNMAFAFTFGSIGIATAIAFGLGGREAAKKLTLVWVDNRSSKSSKSASSQSLM